MRWNIKQVIALLLVTLLWTALMTISVLAEGTTAVTANGQSEYVLTKETVEYYDSDGSTEVYSITEHNYDEQGRIISSTRTQHPDDDNSISHTTYYEHDQTGRILSERETFNDSEEVCTYIYNNEGQLIELHYGDNVLNTKYEYNEKGQLIKESSDALIEYEYGDDSTLVKAYVYQDGLIGTCEYEYDENGNCFRELFYYSDEFPAGRNYSGPAHATIFEWRKLEENTSEDAPADEDVSDDDEVEMPIIPDDALENAAATADASDNDETESMSDYKFSSWQEKYQTILDAYSNAIENDAWEDIMQDLMDADNQVYEHYTETGEWVYDPLLEIPYSGTLTWEIASQPDTDIYYALIDVDGNGTPELLIGMSMDLYDENEIYIVDFFTVGGRINSEIAQALGGGLTHINITDNRTIYYYSRGSAGSFYSGTLYSISADGAGFIEEDNYVNTGNYGSLYHNGVEYTDDDRYDEIERIIASYGSFVDIDWTLLAVGAQVTDAAIQEIGNSMEMPIIPDDALEYNGHYYYVFDNGTADWDDALSYCKQQGGYMAAITSQGENEAVYDYIRSCGYESAYFGLVRDGRDSWTWTTGEAVDYLNWHTGEPNNENTNESYAMFYYKYEDGTWNDGNFGGSTVNGGTAFICEWGEVNAVDDDDRYTVQTYTTAYNNDGNIENITYKWGLSMFEEDPTVYNHDMALVSALICGNSYDLNCIESFLTKDLHFTDFNYTENYSDNEVAKPSMSFATQTYEADGNKKTVVVVAIRGTQSSTDKVTDLVDGANLGFNLSGKHAYRTFLSYCDLYGIDPADENTVIYITGHSLGGASAGRLAIELRELNVKAKIFVYTFASPKYDIVGYAADEFPYIHNIITIGDPVPYVPCWFGFDHIGNIYNYIYDDYFATCNLISAATTYHAINKYLSYVLEGKPTSSALEASGIARHILLSIYCPVDIKIYDTEENLIGYTEGETATSPDSLDIVIFTKGDEKQVFMPTGSNYTVEITGTGDGTMAYTVQSYDGYYQLVEYKSFENVIIKEGKLFESYIDANAAALDVPLYVVDSEHTPVSEVKEDGQEMPLGHIWDSGVVIETATCTENGEILYTCTDCGEIYTGILPTAGHTWDDGTVIKEASETEQGEITYTCMICGTTKSETISRVSLEPAETSTPSTALKGANNDNSRSGDNLSTGDKTGIGLWAGLLLLCGTGVIAAIMCRKRKVR